METRRRPPRQQVRPIHISSLEGTRVDDPLMIDTETQTEMTSADIERLQHLENRKDESSSNVHPTSSRLESQSNKEQSPADLLRSRLFLIGGATDIFATTVRVRIL